MHILYANLSFYRGAAIIRRFSHMRVSLGGVCLRADASAECARGADIRRVGVAAFAIARHFNSANCTRGDDLAIIELDEELEVCHFFCFRSKNVGFLQLDATTTPACLPSVAAAASDASALRNYTHLYSFGFGRAARKHFLLLLLLSATTKKRHAKVFECWQTLECARLFLGRQTGRLVFFNAHWTNLRYNESLASTDLIHAMPDYAAASGEQSRICPVRFFSRKKNKNSH